MNIKDLTKAITDFCTERDWDQFHTNKDMAIALVTESAELCDLFRFKTPEQCQNLLESATSRVKVEDEVADILYWVLRFAERNQINLQKALESKMKKNAEKYPADKVRGSNLKYNES